MRGVVGYMGGVLRHMWGHWGTCGGNGGVLEYMGGVLGHMGEYWGTWGEY